MCCRVYVLRIIDQRSIPLVVVVVELGAESHGQTIAPKANHVTPRMEVAAFGVSAADERGHGPIKARPLANSIFRPAASFRSTGANHFKAHSASAKVSKRKSKPVSPADLEEQIRQLQDLREIVRAMEELEASAPRHPNPPTQPKRR
jgi:hypothetical protein